MKLWEQNRRIVKMGPIGRGVYTALTLCMLGPSMLFLMELLEYSAESDQPFPVAILVALMLELAAFVISTVYRLKDLGEPARRAWLLLVPGYNLYFIGRLFIREGSTVGQMAALPLEKRAAARRLRAVLAAVVVCFLVAALIAFTLMLRYTLW